jgi:hypothetical protein
VLGTKTGRFSRRVRWVQIDLDADERLPVAMARQ